MKKIKTKKTKIIIASILLGVIFVTISLLIMCFNKIEYSMDYNKPSRIVVYYNSDKNNVVFEQNDVDYNKIYSLINNAYKQPVLTALTAGELIKKVKVNENVNTSIDFGGIKVEFVYDLPQIVKYKNKDYTHNGECYWYQNLIFNITSTNNFKYNSVYIIPPETSNVYSGQFKYSLHYRAYSNFSKTHKYLITLFD